VVSIDIPTVTEKLKTIELPISETITINDTKSFYNSVTLTFIGPKRRSVKIFKNGTFHVTGGTSLSNTLDLVLTIISALQLDINITDFKINMINTCVKIPIYLDMPSLLRVFPYAHYDKERHAAMKVKIQCEQSSRSTTVLIFRTGNILITGIQKPRELTEAYRFVMGAIDTHYEHVTCEPGENNEPVRKKQKIGKTFNYNEFI
jgi:TATA-box binding protein (TBP) (component of TFIID and TFIIIB)